MLRSAVEMLMQQKRPWQDEANTRSMLLSGLQITQETNLRGYILDRGWPQNFMQLGSLKIMQDMTRRRCKLQIIGLVSQLHVLSLLIAATKGRDE